MILAQLVQAAEDRPTWDLRKPFDFGYIGAVEVAEEEVEDCEDGEAEGLGRGCCCESHCVSELVLW